EARRLYGVIDKRLAESAYLAGDDYSIADIATFPWLRSHERQGQDLNDFPDLRRWYEIIEVRPAVRRGIDVLKDLRREFDNKAHENLFGTTQYQRR
ncbi:MAG: glutathione binding-like protein, partial [Gammaproteobacteria bacterium]